MRVQVVRHLFGFGLALLVSLTMPLITRAQDSSFEYGEIDGLFEQTEKPKGYWSFGQLDQAFARYSEAKARLSENVGFTYLIEDRLIMQWANGASIYDNELNLIARQELMSQGAGGLTFNLWGQFANSLDGTTGGAFQNHLGILSPLNGGNSGPATSNQILQMAAFEYVHPGEHWRVQAGKLSLRTLVNLNRYANGDSEMFFSPMLGNNPVVPYTALLGLGVYGQYRTDLWSIAGLVRAPDTELGLTTDAWQNGHRGYVIEAALTPTIRGLGPGEYRLTWSLDEANATLPRMETWSISADQDIGPRIGAFVRYATADVTFRDFQQRAALGFQVKEPFGFPEDRLGVGAWWGEPTNPTLNDERGIEVFYRAQVSPFLQITPDVQIVFDPALSPAKTEIIFGLRLRLAL